MKNCTERDKEILKFISAFQALYGYSPSIREIGKNLYMSTTAASRHLNKLVELGYLKITPKTPRSIVLTLAM